MPPSDEEKSTESTHTQHSQNPAGADQPSQQTSQPLNPPRAPRASPRRTRSGTQRPSSPAQKGKKKATGEVTSKQVYTRKRAAATTPLSPIAPSPTTRQTDEMAENNPPAPNPIAPLPPPKTVREQLERDLPPVPTITESASARNARLARVQTGTETDADREIARQIQERDSIAAANEAILNRYSHWTPPESTGRRQLDTYTTVGADGVVVMPEAGRRPDEHMTLAKHYVDGKALNMLGMTPDEMRLCEMLDKLNGDDFYSNEAVALGKLHEDEYLVLPADFAIPIVPDEFVGTVKAKSFFTMDYLWGVYVLNKAAHKETTNDADIKFGLARMEAVKAGWWKNQRETKLAPVPADFFKTAKADEMKIQTHIAAARNAAWLVPFAQEHTFRTKGHHFITGLSSEYTSGYEVLFKAAMRPEVTNYLPPDILYHKAFHWISPARVWHILMAKKDGDLIPEAIKLRMTSAPAGSAIITTASAVIRALQATGLYDEMKESGICDFEAMLALDEKIRANPPKYHRVPSAYNLPPLSGPDLAEFNRMKLEGEKFGPIAKAFCSTILKNAPLGRQKVLSKAAQANPALEQRSKRYFQAYLKRNPDAADPLFPKRRHGDGAGPSEG